MCEAKHRRKIKNIPKKEELFNLLKLHKNFIKVGKLLNVSDNSIRKWCKLYNIPHKTEEYKNPYLDIKNYE